MELYIALIALVGTLITAVFSLLSSWKKADTAYVESIDKRLSKCEEDKERFVEKIQDLEESNDRLRVRVIKLLDKEGT